MPEILNLRGRGGVVPAGAVYVGGRVHRGPWRLAASRWANPFRIGRDGTRDAVIAQYRTWLLQQPALMAALPELRGKDFGLLVCPRTLSCGGAARELAKCSTSE